MRADLLGRKRGEARSLLGQLVALAGDQDACDNLKTLIDGVAMEVRNYLAAAGPIRERLITGLTLGVIQGELDGRIPHWRAFVNDIADLQLARDGLPPHEDPALKRRILGLEKKIATGAIPEAIEEWNELGRPEAAASGLFVQIVDGCTRLREQIEARNWQAATACHEEMQRLLAEGGANAYRPGLENHLGSLGSKLRWETLLEQGAKATGLGQRERSKLLVEFFESKDEIQRLATRDNSLGELQERIESAIGELSCTARAAPEKGNSLKVLLMLFLIILLTLVGIWICFGYAGSPASGAGVHNFRNFPASGSAVCPMAAAPCNLLPTNAPGALFLPTTTTL